MAKVIVYAATSVLVVLGLAASLMECGLTSMFHGITKEELTSKLAETNLAPEQVLKLIKRASHDKTTRELKLNGLGLEDLLALSHTKLEDCDDDVVLERLGQCEQVAAATATGGDNHFASVVNYCKDNMAKLIGFCAKNIDELTQDYLLEVESHDLNTIRQVVAKQLHEPKPDFKALIDAYLGPAGLDTQRKHTDLGNSCEHFTQAFNPIKVVLEHEREFGIAASESSNVSGWMVAHKMCEFFFANYETRAN